ncbi:MAG: pantetheine-phosphate adenylyltransferase [Candidatus Thermoplasmatota archaeon]|nr:pantetheine-phosphate adenylyltransferase [Candidatus Thermoplasmatota archaeon]MBU1940471.1 pantetheine-phosphate adenylyltransferase [Candidatus Thermoplasmatota archaeon]
MRVCLGGTFNIFHKGHKYLIDKAFEIAGKHGYVFIGVADGGLVEKKKFLKPYVKRVNTILGYLEEKKYVSRVEILPIDTKYGFAVDVDFDAIIVSPETQKNAREINEKRQSLGKKPLQIVEISYILADDNKPISSTRIFNKEIDEEGRILT